MQTRVMRRDYVGVMMAGQGPVPDMFDITRQFQHRRWETEETHGPRPHITTTRPSQEEARRWVGGEGGKGEGEERVGG